MSSAWIFFSSRSNFETEGVIDQWSASSVQLIGPVWLASSPAGMLCHGYMHASIYSALACSGQHGSASAFRRLFLRAHATCYSARIFLAKKKKKKNVGRNRHNGIFRGHVDGSIDPLRAYVPHWLSNFSARERETNQVAARNRHATSSPNLHGSRLYI
jgi:hypothetical protein